MRGSLARVPDVLTPHLAVREGRVVRRARERLTYANVVATLALFVALGGGAYAAGVIPRNSVGPRQLRRNSVTSAKIKNGAVTTNKLKDGAVTGSKLAPGAVGNVPNATNATNATNASHAADADQLGGSPASAFLKGVPAGYL